jgi:hypothetical protein
MEPVATPCIMPALPLVWLCAVRAGSSVPLRECAVRWLRGLCGGTDAYCCRGYGSGVAPRRGGRWEVLEDMAVENEQYAPERANTPRVSTGHTLVSTPNYAALALFRQHCASIPVQSPVVDGYRPS